MSAHAQVLVLGCPNSYFKDYLTEHFKAVIEEELRKAGERRPVIFQIIERPPETKEEPTTRQEPTKEAEPPKIELAPKSPKRARRDAARDQLKERCCVYQNGRSTFLIADYSSKLKLLEADEAEEDRREKIEELKRAKEALDETRRDQRAKPSAWWSEDKATPKKLRQLAEQVQRDEVKETQKPKRE